MAENSAIEWCDHTFNPWIGCTRVSPACDHCYAACSTPARTLGIEWGPHAERHRTAPSTWAEPIAWNARAADFQAQHGRRQRVFCASLADVFDNQVHALWRWALFRLIASTPHLDWLLLTKRIGNAREMLNDAAAAAAGEFVGAAEWDRKPWPNVWLGATVATQAEADRDVPKLLATPAAVRFLSVEPMLGPISLETIYNTDFGEGQPYLHPLAGRVSDGHGDSCGAPAIDWVICGGESGPGARPMHPQWARSLRDQCAAVGVPFLFKQWGEWAADQGSPTAQVAPKPWNAKVWPDQTIQWRTGKKAAGRLLDGVLHDGYPTLRPANVIA